MKGFLVAVRSTAADRRDCRTATTTTRAIKSGPTRRSRLRQHLFFRWAAVRRQRAGTGAGTGRGLPGPFAQLPASALARPVRRPFDWHIRWLYVQEVPRQLIAGILNAIHVEEIATSFRTKSFDVKVIGREHCRVRLDLALLAAAILAVSPEIGTLHAIQGFSFRTRGWIFAREGAWARSNSESSRSNNPRRRKRRRRRRARLRHNCGLTHHGLDNGARDSHGMHL